MLSPGVSLASCWAGRRTLRRWRALVAEAKQQTLLDGAALRTSLMLTKRLRVTLSDAMGIWRKYVAQRMMEEAKKEGVEAQAALEKKFAQQAASRMFQSISRMVYTRLQRRWEHWAAIISISKAQEHQKKRPVE